jgi:hypothetical protein
MTVSGKIFVILIFLSGMCYNSNAQIYVTIRPARPVVVNRPSQPGPDYIWVDEDWRAGNNRYEWAGGHWVARPRQEAVWVPGHWDRQDRGEYWVPGTWNDNHYKHDNGKHKGWDKQGEKGEKHFEKEEDKEWKKERKD